MAISCRQCCGSNHQPTSQPASRTASQPVSRTAGSPKGLEGANCEPTLPCSQQVVFKHAAKAGRHPATLICHPSRQAAYRQPTSPARYCWRQVAVAPPVAPSQSHATVENATQPQPFKPNAS